MLDLQSNPQRYADAVQFSTRYSQYSSGCPSTFVMGRFPRVIPQGYAIPMWAYLNTEPQFNATLAKSLIGVPDSKAPDIVATATVTPTWFHEAVANRVPQSRYTGALVSACILGVAAFAMTTLLAIVLLRRRCDRQSIANHTLLHKGNVSENGDTAIVVESMKPDLPKWTICDLEEAKPIAGRNALTLLSTTQQARQPPSFAYYGPYPSTNGNGESLYGPDQTTTYGCTHMSDGETPSKPTIGSESNPRNTSNMATTLPTNETPSSPCSPTPISNEARISVTSSEDTAVATSPGEDNHTVHVSGTSVGQE
ncbi:hypothetical protein NMY22_g2075 [Coprinellus aureogranulatus]|nr:hypothetical protein NMY22_g2075 [Coprinellus aureogranulatus]